MKRKIVGMILLLVAIFSSIYIGVYFLFIRSIFGIIKAFKSGILSGAFLFLYSVFKIFIAFPFTELVAYVLGCIGYRCCKRK